MASARKPPLHPAERYIADVLAGREVVGLLVRKAVERHVRDLERSKRKECPFYFDPDAAEHTIGFFRFLCHSKGEWGQQQFELEPWQQFIVWCIYGWKRKTDALRRFRTAYIEIARKNGKSTKSSGLANYHLVADGEPGAEVYALATKRSQAKIVFEEAKRMVLGSPLTELVQIYKDCLTCEATNSKFEALPSDSDKLDGLNTSAAIIDELHAHKTRALYDVIDTSTGARRQPLIINITTAGEDRDSFCFDQHEYASKVVRGIFEDDTFFAYVANLDEGDDWRDKSVWKKANPNLGVSVKLDDLERKFIKAINQPAAAAKFRRLHLNQWISSETNLIPMELWNLPANAAPLDVAKLKGRKCYAGIDLAKSQDLNAVVLVFPDDDGGFTLLPKLWIPEDVARERETNQGIKYSEWEAAGAIELVDGAVMDQRLVRDYLEQCAKTYEIIEAPYDPWNATQLAVELRDDCCINVVEFPQTVKNFNEATRHLVELVRQGKLRHGGHPVLTWNADNLRVRQDPQGNMRPVKPDHGSPYKIDGMVAAIMGIARAITQPEPTSVYENRGLLQL